MGTIFSGTGLISGLDINSLVNSLMAIDARPVSILKGRIGTIDATRTAMLEVSARVSAMLGRFNDLVKPAFFSKISAKSSNANVLGVTTGSTLAPGSYTFRVRSLASSHQLISSGVLDATAPLPAGTLTIESDAARVNSRTTLGELNGFAGVQRGSFEIVDGDGKRAAIDISTMRTLADVVGAINKAGTAITARVSRDRIVLDDSTGRSFSIREVDGGSVAADLGFAGTNSVGSGSISGRDLTYLSTRTPLAALNDGNGIRRARAGGDFTIIGGATDTITVDLSGLLNDDTRIERLNGGAGVSLGKIKITNRMGTATEIDLSGLTTIGQIREKINAADAGVNVVVTGEGLVLSDSTAAKTGTLKVEDLEGGSTARGLGIAASTTTQTITGRKVLRVETIGDVLAAINYAKGNDAGTIEASIAAAGDRIVIRDSGGGTSALTLGAIAGSRALVDLGFAPGQYGERGDPGEATGKRIIGGIDSALLATINGGSGVAVRDGSGAGATIRIVDATGAQADVDLSNAETLADVIESINALGVGVRAGFDATGTRLVLRNAEGVSGSFTVSDVSLGAAAGLGIAGTGTEIRGGNLQKRYVNENTLLETLNGGRGVARGRFRITDSLGASTTVDLSSATVKSLQDVIDKINASGIGVRASINATGDGLLLEDTEGGDSAPAVAEDGSTTARDLNLLGAAKDGRIDGSYEFSIKLGAGESLEDLAAAVNRTTLARASVYNTGGGTAPFRLSITSRSTGTIGGLIVDGGALALGFSTLTSARDAEVIVGEGGSGVSVRSSDNTLENIVPGMTLNLIGESAEPVTVTATRDTETLLAALNGFVTDFNATLDRINQLTKYNAETEERGILLGDSTAALIQSRLMRLVTQTTGPAGNPLRRLSDLGFKLGGGARLSFDAEKFKTAIEANPEGVAAFFTSAEGGAAVQIKNALESITGTGGVIKRRSEALERQKESFNDRIDALNVILERKRARLLRQFRTMEETLSGLQSQQTSLSSIAALSTNGNR